MSKLDSFVYLMHGVFWGTFGIGLLIRGKIAETDAAQTSQKELTARFSRVLIVLHAVAFGAIYLGLGRAIFTNRVPGWFPGQRLVGGIVIEAGGLLAAWAVATFRSWRLRAKVESSHELVTSGPFRFLRHPIYMGLNMFALGTAIWVPTPLVWTGFVLMALGSDLRARAEEQLLTQAFGSPYCDYCAGTRRFIPGVY